MKEFKPYIKDPLNLKPPMKVLLADMKDYVHDPLAWVYYAFRWNDPGELKDFDGPDYWQTEVLEDIGAKLKARTADVSEVIRIAMAAGNGPGKSALIAWLILWAMSTYEDTRGVVTANTENQLKTKTWAELAKWYRLCICKHWFVLTATAIYAKQKEHERTWRIDQVPWSEEKTEAFAGLHNRGKRLLLIFDESSAIPDKIWEVAEGAMTDKDTEIIWIVSGNPTRNTGRFKQCWGKFKHRWAKWQIDTRKSKLVNQSEIQKQIDDLGIDSDWVKVHILGLFPSASDLQFISTTIAEEAFGKKVGLNTYFYAPKIIGVDPAWTGGDKIVIGLRQGITFRILKTYEKNDDDKMIADDIARFETREQADAVFIDQGYGTGIYSFGKHMNRQWILVNFGSKSSTPGYANKRAEIWGKTKEWLKEGGCIPARQTLLDDLTGPEYSINIRDEILLESKDKMRKRGLASPGEGDALALTFSYPVKAKFTDRTQLANQKEYAKSEYQVI